MKKIFKIIVPVLLVLLIIASIFWYCFVYDRNMIRDLLLSQARYHATNGNPKISSWFYDLAYEHSYQDESVAIELANQFKAKGNYTKAEVTLSNAIADGGTAELYIALCKTYVEQDKLLDAVGMLDKIGDPVIKAQLDALRPDAPAADPLPGFYNEYIQVSMHSDVGTLYYTTGAEYPSTDDAPFSDPITLPAGETIVRAVSVADNGLVSPLSTFGFTVGGIIEEVTFADSAIESSIRTILEIEADQPMYSNQLWNITSFVVPEGSMNLQDLVKLPYLESLTVTDQTFDSISFLSSLSHLTELKLSDCRFPADEMEIIASLPSLQRLTMTDCSISTIAGLEKAQSITHLNLSNNTIRNLQPLSAMASLQDLDLSYNALTDLSSLSTLSALESLNVSHNVLTSIAPIATCMHLTSLNVGNNALTSLSAVDKLNSLTQLTANHNALSDVQILEECTALVELDISNNSVADISVLSNLTNLEVLNFSRNQVSAIPAWPDGSKLRSIDGSRNQIESISNLKNLHNLTHVYMDYNLITSVDDLSGCYSLVMVNIYGNEIENVDALTDHDIIVNYDPT